jgi:phage gpG-like protein
MADRTFANVASFARFLEEQAAIAETVVVEAAEAASHILYDHVRRTFGDATKLAELAEATQDERVAQGYSPNEPLLRDGELLRDSVERIHEGLVAGVGSNEPIMAYHEFGYVSRGGTPVPPRPVFEIALYQSEPEVIALMESAVETILGGK